jgi:hypothetical protein
LHPPEGAACGAVCEYAGAGREGAAAGAVFFVPYHVVGSLYPGGGAAGCILVS